MRRLLPTLIIVLLLFSGIRLIVGVNAGIIPDEAYYWSWSLQPDWCYWDQPGGIAWTHALWDAVFGDSRLSLRGLAVACALLVSLLAYGLFRKVLGELTAFWGVVLLQLTPLFAAGSVLILHDSVLLVFSLAAWWALAVALLDDRPQFWGLVGLAIAAAVYAKFSAVILGGGFLLVALLHPTGRRHLRTPWPYLGGLLAAVLLAPVVLWNIKHDWIAYHAVSKLLFHPDIVGWRRVGSMLEYILGQLGVVTPVLAVMGLIAAWVAVAKRSTEEGERRILLIVPALLILFYFLLNSFSAKIQANWPALAWVVLTPLAVDYAIARVRVGALIWRKVLGIGIGLALAVTLLMHTQVFVPLLPLKPDITDQFYGWEEVAERVEDLRQQYPQARLMTRRYQIAGELVYHLHDHPAVITADYAHRGSQFTLWQDYSELIGQDALYIDSQSFPGKLRRHFTAVKELAPCVRERQGQPVEVLHIYLANNFHWQGPEQAYISDPIIHHLKRLERRKNREAK